MNESVLDRPSTAGSKSEPGIIDCDIHPYFRGPEELAKYLPERWKRHIAEYGARSAEAFLGILAYPRLTPGGGVRLDAWPPAGGPPASDLKFLQEQLLDPLNIEYGVLQPLAAGPSMLNLDLGIAMTRAVNDWQLEKFCHPDPRLKASLCVAQEDARASVEEIERRVGEKAFVQVALPPQTLELLGKRRYWPIYEAAEHYGMPIGIHVAGAAGHANFGGGWFSFYIEEHFAFAHGVQSTLASLIFEGVLERFPNLKIVLVEGGFGWLPAFMWRLDREWERMKSEVPHVKRPPSEYIRKNFWFTTQPIEEPMVSAHLLDTLRWIGMDRLLFSTDYPHWDFDDPRYAFKISLTPDQRRMIMRDNAEAIYRFN